MNYQGNYAETIIKINACVSFFIFVWRSGGERGRGAGKQTCDEAVTCWTVAQKRKKKKTFRAWMWLDRPHTPPHTPPHITIRQTLLQGAGRWLFFLLPLIERSRTSIFFCYFFFYSSPRSIHTRTQRRLSIIVDEWTCTKPGGVLVFLPKWYLPSGPRALVSDSPGSLGFVCLAESREKANETHAKFGN